MKVLLVTDNPSLPSGLARVGREIASILHLQENYDFSYLGLHSQDIPQGPCRVFFCDGYGRNFIAHSDFDIVVTVGDPFHFDYIPALQNRHNFIWISYITIDSVNAAGNLPLHWQLALSNPDFLAVTSRFGRDAIANFLQRTPTYLPLGVGENFCRMQGDEREKLRIASKLNDSFVVTSINRNCIRKQFPLILKAAQKLSDYKTDEFPGGVKFLLHTNAENAYGYNLSQLIRDYGLSNVFFARQLDCMDDDLNQIYNIGDCFLSTSGAEGFGLTILEAMACGLPIIGADYSSIPELVNTPSPCGILIKPAAYLTSETGTELALLNPDDIEKSIIELSTNAELRKKYSVQAVENAAAYSWDIMKRGILETVELIEKRECVYSRENGEMELQSSNAPMHQCASVELLAFNDIPWRDFTYATISRVRETAEWTASTISEAILASEQPWVALVGPGAKPQRGWLFELLKLTADNPAVIVSTCINAKGEMVEGEIRCGNNLLFFPYEGLPTEKGNKEISATVFSCALINRDIFKKIGGFNESLATSYFDIEYCLRLREEGYKIIQSAKSIVLKMHPPQFNNADGNNFKLATEETLNTPVYVQYKGQRKKIRTLYGDFENEPVKIPYRIALDLVCNYKHIDFVNLKKDVNHFANLIENGGKVLIARNMGLGDVFSALFFAARPLKLANPDIRLTVCVNKPYAGVVKWLPWVDGVLLYPDGLSMANEFDYFKDLSYIPESHDPKSQLPRPEIFAKAVLPKGLFRYDYDAIRVPEDFARNAIMVFDSLGIGKDGRKIVGIQATCESPIRVYAPEYLTELVNFLIKDFDVVLFGTDEHWRWGLERWNGEHLFSFVNATDSIEHAAALMSLCDYAIAPDSGLMHLWAFMKTPVLCLFGNINPINRIKYYPTAIAMYPEGEIDCIPCGDVFNPCPECSDLGAKGTFSGRCMRMLYPERVYLKFLEMIDQRAQTTFRAEIPQCPICGGTDFEIENEISFWDNGPIPKTSFVKCKNDGLVFVAGRSESIGYCENYFQSNEKKYYEDILSDAEIRRQTAAARRVLDEYQK